MIQLVMQSTQFYNNKKIDCEEVFTQNYQLIFHYS